MKFTGFLFDSLKIESSKNKWASRLLFIVIFAVSAVMKLSPPGDPDLSVITQWLDKVETMNGAQISQLTLPVISQGNVIYLVASFIVAILFVLFLFMSTCISLNDQDDKANSCTMSGFFYKMPSLLALILFILIPVNFLAQSPVFMIFSFLIISAVYLSPAIILNEKTSSLEAVLKSVKTTYGLKFSIFMNFFTIYFIYQILIWLFSLVIHEDSAGFFLVDGYLFAFTVVAIGKNIGEFYKISKVGSQD